MPVQIHRLTNDHAHLLPNLGQICYEAFGALQDQHSVERDFDSPQTATMVVSLFATRPDFAGFVAMDGKIPLGSNFLGASDTVAGVGPITIRPDAQARSTGRALMLAVMDEAARRGIGQVRLMQEAINTASLSPYTKLGFDWREACSLMRPAPDPTDDPRIRPLTQADLDAVERISQRHDHASRRVETAGFLASGFPAFALEIKGTTTGYYLPGFLGHGFAPTPADMASLMLHAARHAPPPFLKALVQLSEHALHRELLARGCRSIKLINYMTTGPYRPPDGAWIPSIGM